MLSVLFFAIDSDTQLVVRQYVNRVIGGAEPALDRENANMEGGAQEQAVTATEGANASVEGDAVVVDLKKTFELLAKDYIIANDDVPAEIDFNAAKLTLILHESNAKSVDRWEFYLVLTNQSKLRIDSCDVDLDLIDIEGNYIGSGHRHFSKVFPSKSDKADDFPVLINGEIVKDFRLRFNYLGLLNANGDTFYFKPTQDQTPFGIAYKLYDTDKKELASGKQYFNAEQIRRLE